MATTLKARPTRDGFAEGLVELGRRNPKVVVLAGDLAGSTRTDRFQKEFPHRFFNMGIAEQDMLGTAVGLSLEGKIPFVASFTVFVCGRGYDQIRVSVCYNNQNVKIAGSHSGLTTGPDGATAQSLEDIAMMRVLPYMTVLVPADAIEARKATIAAAGIPGPVFIRLGRNPVPIVTTEEAPFLPGKANILRQGRDVAIIACGLMVSQALRAAQALSQEGIEATIVNLHTIKPIDKETLIQVARHTRAVVTAEEHQIYGGLGSAVAEVLIQECPTFLEMVGVDDTFGESGEAQELMEKYGLTWKHVYDKVYRVLEKRRRAGGTKYGI